MKGRRRYATSSRDGDRRRCDTNEDIKENGEEWEK